MKSDFLPEDSTIAIYLIGFCIWPIPTLIWLLFVALLSIFVLLVEKSG